MTKRESASIQLEKDMEYALGLTHCPKDNVTFQQIMEITDTITAIRATHVVYAVN